MKIVVVEVVEYETKEVVKMIECGESMSRAEKVDGGLNINLNHDRFYTRIRHGKRVASKRL